MSKQHDPKHSFDGDDPTRKPLSVNGHGDTSGHIDDIDGAAIPRDLTHDLPSAAAILASDDAAGKAMADMQSLGDKARELNRRWGPQSDEPADACPYCRATTLDRLTETLTECRTCGSVHRPGFDPAALFRMPDVAILRPFRHLMNRRQIIARDYACHTSTGLARVAERLGYRLVDATVSMIRFTRAGDETIDRPTDATMPGQTGHEV